MWTKNYFNKNFFNRACCLFIVMVALAGGNRLYAQDEAGKVWVFGESSRLSFSAWSGTPTPGASTFYSPEGCASISNSSGTLQFYTDGNSVFNAAGSFITNGNSTLYGDVDAQVAILKKPGSDTDYYIFTSSVDGNAPGDAKAYYHVVHYTGSVYQVTSANNALSTNDMSERICIASSTVSDPAYWVIYHSLTGSTFYAFSVTSSGVNLTPATSTGTLSFGSGEAMGQMKVSPCGGKLAIAGGLSKSSGIIGL